MRLQLLSFTAEDIDNTTKLHNPVKRNIVEIMRDDLLHIFISTGEYLGGNLRFSKILNGINNVPRVYHAKNKKVLTVSQIRRINGYTCMHMIGYLSWY